MKDKENILALLKQEVAPAVGCTEPAAVALAGAYAASVMEGKIISANLIVSPNILKNGMGVGIPNTNLLGLEIAFALGILVAKPEKELEVLSDLDAETIDKAQQMLAEKRIQTKMLETEEKVWIEAVIKTPKSESKAILRWRHNWLYHLEKDKKILRHQELEAENALGLISCTAYTVKDYYDFCINTDISNLEKIDLGMKVNRKIADFGLSNNSGINVGKMIMEQIKSGLLGDDIHHYAMALTAAATDARMSGCNLPVISNSGSGNQGLAITLPIIAVAEKLGSNKEELIRALALGHLVSVHIKQKIGILSCICGCLSASAGAASGIVMLLKGNYSQIEYAIKNMIADTAGMVCDGAKEGCSLKVATTTSAAVQAALLAKAGICVSSNDGIITESIEGTIDNLAYFVARGMQDADSTILNIMLNKTK
ncbi:MAG: serine dehydratase subunit alpha family protein [Candidatus Cloacimonas sp.]|jgi:L-cysteine desulfidase|nr:serine dehydratase subunit alpha family protein [Candidatus Cloacimonas sp.]HNX02803.1 L-serine ammonia-lyase, iron-sulfur-dependent, subunit alpha [Candidatus Cloacimonas sp.]HPS61095.1 L-serine ammonia-lyase, iron-sulfur-dependent, subunit alpha [Candidatus Cloacimonas sp.]